MKYKMQYTAIKAYEDATNNNIDSLNRRINEIIPKIEEDIIKAANAGFFFTYFYLDIEKIKEEIHIDSQINKEITTLLSLIDSILKENLYETNIDHILSKYCSKFNNLKYIQIDVYWNVN